MNADTYNDDYATCARTFATLRVYPSDANLERVTQVLALVPTQTSAPTERHPRQVHGWFLSSQDQVDSRDLRRHLDWLIARLAPCASQLEVLRRDGARTSVSCFWTSAHGHGGPIIGVTQMKALAELGLDLELDVYVRSQSS